MSDYSQGPGWWQASDGKWYPPQGDQAPAPAPAQYAAPAPGAAPAYGGQPAPKMNGLALASLIVSIVLFCGIGPIPAVIMGFMARKQIRESGGTQTGEGMALAGIIIGFVGIVFTILYIVFVVILASSDPDTFNNDFNNDFNSMRAFAAMVGW